jgi:transcriptional regulator of nitric oxide reductase
MFLIYVQHIFQTLDHWPEIDLMSYIDDIALVTGSSCARTNGIRLQLAVQRLCKVAERSQIQFDIDKTEYMHFHRGRTPIEIGITINTGSSIIEVRPQEQVKWLGMWLDRKLTFKKHVEMRCAAATRAFYSIKRLSNTSKGLSFQAIRQLYIACVKAVGAYGVPYW